MLCYLKTALHLPCKLGGGQKCEAIIIGSIHIYMYVCIYVCFEIVFKENGNQSSEELYSIRIIFYLVTKMDFEMYPITQPIG
jgi:hypothetical protein